LIPDILVEATVYSSIISLVCMGFTLIHIIEDIPNLAQGTFMVFGMYVSFTVGELFRLSPYLGMPFAFVLGGTMAALFFTAVIRVLSRNNIGEVYMTLSTLAFQIFMVQTLYIYAFWIRETLWVWSYGFLFEANDFQFLGLQGVFPVSLVACILTVAGLRRLMGTKTGIAMRASAENQELAEVMGVDTSRIRSLTWFLSGGLASLAGAMFPMMFQGAPHIGSTIISTIMAASILGGLGHILGAVVGGFIIGFTRTILPGVIAPFFHDSAVAYTIVLIVLSIACVFLLEPRGIMGVYERVAESRKSRQIS